MSSDLGDIGVVNFVFNYWNINVLFVLLIIIVKNRYGCSKINGK